MIQLELRVMMKINTDQYFIISTASSSMLNAHDIKVNVLIFSHRLENHVNIVGNYFLVAKATLELAGDGQLMTITVSL